jgi:hypothetical protein
LAGGLQLSLGNRPLQKDLRNRRTSEPNRNQIKSISQGFWEVDAHSQVDRLRP